MCFTSLFVLGELDIEAFTTSRYDNLETPMLVLSRKLGEKIVIGDNIVITVVKIDRNQIRIGIEAPHDVPVYREEIAPQRAGKGALEEVTV
jgi:carbon storage regulator